MVSRWVKRLIDIAGALCAILLLFPIMMVIAVFVRRQLGRPVLFAQHRPGRKGRSFPMYKFRTMTDQRDAHGQLLPDAMRITRLGRFLRSTSLDELPELLNVLAGAMSLVGPRPLLMEYLDRYSPEQSRRHEVRPGITGWAQVNGRNDIDWEQRLRLDVWYVDHWSLWLDIKILWMTIWKVVRREGIHAKGHATMPEFVGHPQPSRPDDVLENARSEG